jgi:hypothetical protein
LAAASVIGVYQGAGGQKFPQVIVNSADLAVAKHKLSNVAVLDMAAAVGFQRA